MKLWSSYSIDDLDRDKQDKLYQVFYDTYMKETGGAFTRHEFEWRANNWRFFGVAPDTNGRECGGIAVRIQRSGSLKLVASFGNVRGIMDGLKEMESEFGDRAIWGFMPKKMIGMLCRADPNFVEPPSAVVKLLVKVFSDSGAVQGVGNIQSDGGVEFETPSGTMVKYCVCNKNEIKWLLDGATDPSKAHRLPVPQIVVKPVVGLLKKILLK